MSRSYRADLHTHSNASDGELAPAALVERAARQGLSVLALTDHDTTAGISEAVAAAVAFDVRLIAGVEISADVPSGELHLLGYGIDPSNAELQRQLATFRDFSSYRLNLMLQRLNELGIEIPAETIVPDSPDDSVGRPHVARALVAAGYATSVSDAFARFLGEDRPAYVRKEKIQPEDAIRLIARAGGLAVLAHPFGVLDLDLRLPVLVAYGLAGLECFYAEYSAAQRMQLVERANRFGLLITGGSDFHGDRTRTERKLGSVPIPERHLVAFLDRLDHR